MSAPTVSSYLDYRAFLRAWLSHRKQHDPAYSYEAFAEAGACAKSTLPNVLSGSRSPRPATLDAFARAMDLTPAERNTLGLLVDLDRAASVAERRAVMERLLASERHGQTTLAEHTADDTMRAYLSDWRMPAIRELLSLPGARFDAAWVARTVRPQLSVDEAQEALDGLLALGFVEVGDDGTVVLNAVRITTSRDAAAAGVLEYHQRVVPAMAARLSQVSTKDRHFGVAVITLPEALVPEARRRIHAAVVELASLGDTPSEGPRRVYHLSVQLMPVSEPVG